MFSLIEAKLVAALALSGGSLFAGLMPKWMGLAQRIEHSLTLSIILCFGAGVLLSTSLLHILNDTILSLPTWGGLSFISGFMTLYFVDELVLYISLGVDKLQVSHHHHADEFENSVENEKLLGDCSHSKYGSFGKSSDKETSKYSTEDASMYDDVSHSSKLKVEDDPSVEGEEKKSDNELTKDERVAEYQIVSDRPSDVNGNKPIKTFGLVIALCIHSILEGLAVGTQPSPYKVMILLLAVSCHKLVITFCLGAELLSDGSSFVVVLGFLTIYAVSSGSGVLIGMFINSTNTAMIPLLQGLAGGSLLYVTVGEILPRERLHKGHCIMPKSTGLFQFLFVLLGIIPIAIMNEYFDDSNT